MLRFTIIFISCFLSNIYFAKAQLANDNIDERVQANSASYVIKADDPLIMDENIVLLKRIKLWTAYAIPSLQFTDNVFLNNDDKKSDFVAALTTGLNFSLNTKYKIAFNAGFSGSKVMYQKYHALDYNSLNGNLGVSYTYKNWLFSLQYLPSFVFEKEFKSDLITLNRFSGAVSKIYSFRDVIGIRTYTNAHYSFADPNEFTHTQYDSGFELQYPLSSKVILSLEPVAYYKRYNDYFESQTGIERVDLGSRVSARLKYAIKNNMQFSADLNYTKNFSTLENNSYEATSFTPSLQFSYKF